MNQFTFQGKFRIHPNVYISRKSFEEGTRDYKKIETAFRDVERRIKALPDSLVIEYDSLRNESRSVRELITDSAEIKMVTQYDYPYKEKYHEEVVVKQWARGDYSLENPMRNDVRPTFYIDFIERLVKRAEELVALFGGNADSL